LISGYQPPSDDRLLKGEEKVYLFRGRDGSLRTSGLLNP
jgi:hypothetical protein